MDEADMFKLAERLDEDVTPCDFVPLDGEDEPENFNSEFLAKIAADKEDNGKILGHNDENAENANNLNHNNNKIAQKTQNGKVNTKKAAQNAQKRNIDRFKDGYFSYYDDIKIDSHKVIDW